MRQRNFGLKQLLWFSSFCVFWKKKSVKICTLDSSFAFSNTCHSFCLEYENFTCNHWFFFIPFTGRRWKRNGHAGQGEGKEKEKEIPVDVKWIDANRCGLTPPEYLHQHPVTSSNATSGLVNVNVWRQKVLFCDIVSETNSENSKAKKTWIESLCKLSSYIMLEAVNYFSSTSG